MAGILSVGGQENLTVYANIVNVTAGDIWNGTAFEAITAGNVGTYDVALTETALKGVYKANFPSAITSGMYLVFYKAQSGGSPSVSDVVIGQDKGVWDGSNWSTGLAFTSTQKAEIATEVLALLNQTAIPELASIPDASPTLFEAVVTLYMWLRNNTTSTENTRTLRNDAGTAIASSTMSDDGSTFQQGKFS